MKTVSKIPLPANTPAFIKGLVALGLGFLLYLPSCGLFDIKVTKVTPNTVHYDSTTDFVLHGQNLNTNMVVTMGTIGGVINTCTLDDASSVNNNSSASTIGVTCTAPASNYGNSVVMNISYNNSTVTGGNQTINLMGNYTKVGADGTLLPLSAARWSCVYDVATTYSDGNPHYWMVPQANATDPYSYLSSFEFSATASANDPVGQSCNLGTGVNCNTANFIQYTNTKQLCGRTGWHLPASNDLYQVINCNAATAFDPRYFPNLAQIYWSANTVDASNGYQVSVGNCSPQSANFFQSAAAAILTTE